MTPDRRFTRLVEIERPIVQAPMVGPKAPLALAVCRAGGLGSLGCAAMTVDQVRAEVAILRSGDGENLAFNLNFFSHTPGAADLERDAAWSARLAPFYAEFGIDPNVPVKMANRAPFGIEMCDLVVELRPKVVSFHFGLPEEQLLRRVKAAGCLIFASATTVREARWLEARGVDAVIAQGAEAGGHRGMFLTDSVPSQIGTIALVPQVVDAVGVPVIAAGGIADARGVAAALALGAAAAQVGTAYLLCPEAGVSAPHLEALRHARDEDTAVTNVFTGRPARGLVNRAMRELGPISADVPGFPGAAVALQPLRMAAEGLGSGDFSPLWSGQAVGLAREMSASALTRQLAPVVGDDRDGSA